MAPRKWQALLARLTPSEAELLIYAWREIWARSAQLPPPEPWTYWLVLAGRGFGKTRTGAEQMRHWAESGDPFMRLIARTPADVRDTMIEGESGIMAVSPPWFKPHYERGVKALTWPNGARALVYSSFEPDALRGPQCTKCWCDELRTWMYQRETWDNHLLGARLGNNPQTVITTTSSSSQLLKEIIADPATRISKGSTYDNRSNLADEFLKVILKRYEGTRLGEQEIFAKVLDEDPRALWTRAMIEDHRQGRVPDSARTMVGIDVAITSNESSAETGIIGAGRLKDEYWVFADESLRGRPEAWGRSAILLAHRIRADCFVAEWNQGGEMIESVIRAVERDMRTRGELPPGPSIPVHPAHATRGKHTRAEPISALYEQGKVHHVGRLTELEDQQTSWVTDDGQPSPDRLDALVWVLTKLSGTIDFVIH